MKSRMVSCGTPVVMACVCALSAIAGDNCVDQQIEPGAVPGCGIYTDKDAAQTFTCQLGGMITTLEVYVDAVGTPVGPLMVALYSTEAGVPGNEPGAVLVERAVDISGLTLPQYLSVNPVIAAIYVAPEDVLALVLRTPESGNGPANHVVWLGDDAVGYAGGSGLFRAFAPGWQLITNESAHMIDMGLRTYLDCVTPGESRSWSSVKASYR